MNLAVAVATLALVFPAELPDKTALASLVLGTRYHPLYVFIGAALAFAVHVALAVIAGGLLALAPRRITDAVVAVAFLAGALLLLRGHRNGEEDQPGDGRPATFGRVAAMSFAVIIVAEFGDLTQILTASLAARYHDPLSVAVGAVLALWAVAALAIVGGRALLRLVPMRAVTIVAATAMAVLAVLSLVAAIRG